jgi:hypothetical protein
MNLKSCFFFAVSVILLAACSRTADEPRYSAHISGQITVDEALDDSGDYSGIELLVSYQDASGELTDTLFYAITDTEGYFSGTASFDEKDLYPVVVSRNQNTFGIINMVFADGDSVDFRAVLPNVSQTAEVNSRENEVYRTFERVDRNFNRVAQFIGAGAMSADSIRIELSNWSDIYWQVYEEHAGTLGAELAGNASIALASGWNDSLMIARSETLLENEKSLRSSGRSVLMDYHAEESGLDETLSFLNRLERLVDSEQQRMGIQIDRIELLYDSSRTREANAELDRFRDQYADNRSAMDWADNISFDLEFLAPGAEFPEFGFQNIFGDSVSSESLRGRPFLLEITRFDNPLYQQQYDRTVAIYQIYNSFGLEIVTVPIATSDVALQAFFEDRGVIWDVVQPNSFDVDELIEQLNVSRVPTRFLVNDRGEIVRRYIGNEYDDVVRGLQQIVTQSEEEE